MESVKETLIEINKTLPAEESNKALSQPFGKQCMAAGMLFEDLSRLCTKKIELQNADPDSIHRTNS